MIVPSGKGYRVKSEGGKNLSKPGLTLRQARARLAQVERFKHMDQEKGHGLRALFRPDSSK